MALAKLFRITDTNGERWHIAAPSFSEAVASMRDWENEPHAADDEIVQSVEVVEDLILGEDRELSLNSYKTLADLAVPKFDYPPLNILRADALCNAAKKMLEMMPPAPYDNVKTNMQQYIEGIKALRSAVDAYDDDIPF